MELALEIASYVFWVLVAITVLVFVHEMGHFLAAKFFGMKVDRFSIGFPPKVFGKTIGETEYVVGATPLGGYVKIAGMIDESMDTEQIASEPDPRDFRAKPVWQRIIVITAGVIFNIILAFLIFFGLKVAYGETYFPADAVEQVYVADSSLAHTIGLRTGDQVLAVNGDPVERYSNLTDLNLFGASTITMDRMSVTVRREGQRLTLRAPADMVEQLTETRGFLGVSALPPIVGSVQQGSHADSLGLQPGDRIISVDGRPVRFWMDLTPALQAAEGPVDVRWLRADSLVDGQGGGGRYEGTFVVQDTTAGGPMLGVGIPEQPLLARAYGEYEHFGLGEALVGGAQDTWVNTAAFVTSLGRLFSGKDDVTKSVGGPVMIAKIAKGYAEAGMRYFWHFVAILSITLAIINILPIPALDGGHFMFLLYEGITRRKPSLKVRMAMQQAGMLLLLAFMVFVIFNDIVRL